jgi:HSP20 family protein
MLSTILDDLYDLNQNISRIFDVTPMYKHYYWPEVNIYNNNNEFVVIAKLPGVKKEDVSLILKDNSLKISGEKKKEEKVDETCYLDERYTGKFERSFLLNEKVDNSNIDAEMKNGLLIIKLVKSPEAKPKSITIK